MDDRDEENLAAAFRDLAPHAAAPETAVLMHERDRETIAAWDTVGALRLVELLPPVYAELSQAIVRRLGA